MDLNEQLNEYKRIKTEILKKKGQASKSPAIPESKASFAIKHREVPSANLIKDIFKALKP